MAGEVDSYLSDQGGIRKNGRRSISHTRLYIIISCDDTRWWDPLKAFNYEVNSHLIQLKLNSALMFTVTATSEGLFAQFEESLCLLSGIIIVLHSFLSQYFEPLIVYIFSIALEIPRWQS